MSKRVIQMPPKKSDFFNAMLYAQDPNTGKWEKIARIDDLDFAVGNDDIVDERKSSFLPFGGTIEFSVKLPTIIDVEAKEDDGQKRLAEF